jgi:hypothetical protein
MRKPIVAILVVFVLFSLSLASIPTTRDDIHWRWAAHKNNVASYETYLKTWPEGRHAAEAQAHRDDNIDSLHWHQASAANTITSYKGYASAHPHGRFTQQAENKASALGRDPGPYNAALRVGTEASMKTFLADYPGHEAAAAGQQALEEISVGRDVVDLLNARKIEIEAWGNDIWSVDLRVRKLVPYPLTVRIPVGTFFSAANASRQNMIATAATEIRLETGDWKRDSVDAACANRLRVIPNHDDSFTIERSSHEAELAKLMPLLNKPWIDPATKQAAIWIVTDDADYNDLGRLVVISNLLHPRRVINELSAARAMRICEEAGFDITRKRIWNDRQTILRRLADPPHYELTKWLRNKK